MAPVLSSNWKTLQATLKKTSQTDPPSAKRKAIEPSTRTKDSIAKRRRLEGNPIQITTRPIVDAKGIPKARKMGGMGSALSSSPSDPAPPNPAPSATLALWAEDNDISAQDLAEAYGGNPTDTTLASARSRSDTINGGYSQDVEIGKYIGIDCEMVGVGGLDDRSVLARVSIVNFHGTQIYDSFVRPQEYVTDWRTHVSGVSTKNMATARDFDAVQKDVSAILHGRILVGHAIKNDLEALMLSHPKRDIRDTSKFAGFRKYSNGRTPSLKKLTKEILGVEIQGGQHSSIEDARATILLFRKYKSAFDIEHAKHYPTASGASSKSKSKSKSKKKKKGKR